MPELNKKYIDEHLIGIHTYESWARAFFEKALNEVKKEIGTNSVPNEEIEVSLKIKPNSRGCITVCAWGVCVHVST